MYVCEYAYSIKKDLEPENGYEVELGMDWAVNQIYLGGRIFRQWMEDEIVYDPLVPASPPARPFAGSNINLPKNINYYKHLNKRDISFFYWLTCPLQVLNSDPSLHDL